MVRIFIQTASEERGSGSLRPVQFHPSFSSDLTFFKIDYSIWLTSKDQESFVFYVFKTKKNVGMKGPYNHINQTPDDYFAVIDDETFAYLILTFGIEDEVEQRKGWRWPPSYLNDSMIRTK